MDKLTQFLNVHFAPELKRGGAGFTEADYNQVRVKSEFALVPDEAIAILELPDTIRSMGFDSNVLPPAALPNIKFCPAKSLSQPMRSIP